MAVNQQNDALVQHLTTRRTVPSLNLGLPMPDSDTLSQMMTIAARVPDHGKLSPWRFILYPTDSGEVIGAHLADLWLRENPDTPDDRQTLELNRFNRAPMVVGVVSTPVRDHKVPVLEQQLSAGAVCLNFIHAAYAFGFSAQWLTEWYCYHEEAASFLGVKPGEHFAGFIHIGTPKLPPSERVRPQLENITTIWSIT